jgi:hypothetical protein
MINIKNNLLDSWLARNSSITSSSPNKSANEISGSYFTININASNDQFSLTLVCNPLRLAGCTLFNVFANSDKVTTIG